MRSFVNGPERHVEIYAPDELGHSCPALDINEKLNDQRVTPPLHYDQMIRVDRLRTHLGERGGIAVDLFVALVWGNRTKKLFQVTLWRIEWTPFSTKVHVLWVTSRACSRLLSLSSWTLRVSLANERVKGWHLHSANKLLW